MAKRKKEGKAPPVDQATAQVATARNDITIPFFTDVLRPIDDIILEKGGGKGLKLYDEIERDAHAYAVLQKRKHQLIGREWVVKAGGEADIDIEAADFIRDQLEAIEFDRLCLELLDATLKGFSVAEMIYAVDGRHIRIDCFSSVDQRRIVFDEDWAPRLLTRTQPMKGEELPARKFAVHRFGAKGSNAYGIGLGAKLFWPVLFKREGVAFWMKFLERFASPIPVGKHPLGAAPAVVNALTQVLEEMNHASAITVPIGTDLETFESRRTGTVDYNDWASFWNAEISKAATGETLSTEMGSVGSRAAAEVHSNVLDGLVDSDADLLSGTLNNGPIRWLTEINYPNAALPTVWRPRPSNEMDLEKVRAEKAKRRSADMAALKEARELGFEPEDVEAYMESVFDGPVRAVETKAPDLAQKKTPLN